MDVCVNVTITLLNNLSIVADRLWSYEAPELLDFVACAGGAKDVFDTDGADDCVVDTFSGVCVAGGVTGSDCVIFFTRSGDPTGWIFWDVLVGLYSLACASKESTGLRISGVLFIELLGLAGLNWFRYCLAAYDKLFGSK